MGVDDPLSLTLIGDSGRAAPRRPRATTRVPTSPRHHPCPYYDTEPPAGPTRGPSKGGRRTRRPHAKKCQGERGAVPVPGRPLVVGAVVLAFSSRPGGSQTLF